MILDNYYFENVTIFINIFVECIMFLNSFNFITFSCFYRCLMIFCDQIEYNPMIFK